MAKKIFTRDVPEQVLSENYGAIYPTDVSRDENGKLLAGASFTIPRMLYNPPLGTTELQRTASIIKRSGLISAAGNTALWTPATGKRFRWMGFSVVVDPATTTAGGSLVTILDGSTTIDDVIALPIAASNIPFRAFGFLSGNGYLSTGIGNVMNLNLSSAATAGGVYVNVWGTEE